MIIHILNEPDEAKDYEFVVAVPYGENFLFFGEYENGYEAEEDARKNNGIIFHNCNIQGKIKRKNYKVSLSFEHDVTAISEDEAEKIFIEWLDNMKDADYFGAIKVKEIERSNKK